MNRTFDPLDGTELLVIDGMNLLHALRRRSGGAEVQPPAALIGRLRGLVPAAIRIEVVLDGAPDPGSRDLRVASGIDVRYSGKLSADTLIARLVADRADGGRGTGRGSAEKAVRALDSTLVVTDDIGLAGAVRQLGARTAPVSWLVSRLSRTRLVAPSVARPRPPQAAQTSDDDDRRGWRPGRGATAKRGNPRRSGKPRHGEP